MTRTMVAVPIIITILVAGFLLAHFEPLGQPTGSSRRQRDFDSDVWAQSHGLVADTQHGP